MTTGGTAFEGFRAANAEDILDVRSGVEKRRVFDYKAEVWSGFGYSRAYLARMEAQDFWDAEFARIDEIDTAARGRAAG